MEAPPESRAGVESLESLHQQWQRTHRTIADLVARRHPIQVIRRRSRRRPELHLAEHIAGRDGIPGLLEEAQARRGIDWVVLARAATSDLDREHPELAGAHAGHGARAGCAPVAPLHRLG